MYYAFRIIVAAALVAASFLSIRRAWADAEFRRGTPEPFKEPSISRPATRNIFCFARCNSTTMAPTRRRSSNARPR